MKLPRVYAALLAYAALTAVVVLRMVSASTALAAGANPVVNAEYLIGGLVLLVLIAGAAIVEWRER